MLQNRANGFGTLKPQPQHHFTISAGFLEFVKHLEGFRAQAYLDTTAHPPVWTIGYGATFMVHEGQFVTPDAASERLRRSLQQCGEDVAACVTVPLTQHQWEALTDFAYNCGVGALRSSTLLWKLNQHDYQGAADELHRWVHAGSPAVVTGLVARRKLEFAWFTENFVDHATVAAHNVEDGGVANG